MRAARLSFAIGSVLALGGCTLLLGYGEPAELAEDAALDAAVSRDASTDSPSDSATEAGEPTAPFCERERGHGFCASFDQADYLAEWEAATPTEAELARDVDIRRSAPAALRISATRSTTGGGAPSATVGHSFVGFRDAPFTAEMAFALRVDTATPGGTFAVLATPIVLAPEAAQPYYLLQLVGRASADESSVALEVLEVDIANGGNIGHSTTASIPRGSWARVSLRFVRSPGERSLQVQVDGTTVLDTPLQRVSELGSPNLTLGLATLDSAPCTWTFHFDDVIADIR